MRIPSFFRSPETGRVVVAQAPNLPLGIFLAAAVVRAVQPDGAVGTTARAVATGALLWWAADELVRGESPFRRVLGGVVLSATLAGIVRD